MSESECYAEGGEVSDDEALLDHCALECMHAIEMKDKTAFLHSIQVLIADVIDKMQDDKGDESDANG